MKSPSRKPLIDGNGLNTQQQQQKESLSYTSFGDDRNNSLNNIIINEDNNAVFSAPMHSYSSLNRSSKSNLNGEDFQPLISSSDKNDSSSEKISSEVYEGLCSFLKTNPDDYEQLAKVPWMQRVQTMIERFTGVPKAGFRRR